MSGRATPSVHDRHVHLWDPRCLAYPWLVEAPDLNCPFTADQFAAIRPAPIEVIFMEADRENGQATDEIEWVRSQAEHHTWIRSAVAHVPLERPAEALATIRRYAADPFVVGVRRNIEDEAPGFTEDSHIREGIQLIARPASPSTHALANTGCPSLRSWPSPARTPRSSSTTSASRSRPPGASGRRHGDGLRNNRTSSASSPAWPPHWHRTSRPRSRSRSCAKRSTCATPTAACSGATGR